MTPLEVAVTQIGKKEDPTGSNWGTDAHPEVRNYLKSVGITFPASWCMAFVYWCHVQALVDGLHLFNALKKTGGVLDQWHSVDPKLKVEPINFLSPFNPLPGDIFIMDHGHGLGHTGFVEFVDQHGVHTIEGNSNNDGSRNGNEVVRHLRQSTQFIGLIRI